jgi:hypothetical protein
MMAQGHVMCLYACTMTNFSVRFVRLFQSTTWETNVESSVRFLQYLYIYIYIYIYIDTYIKRSTAVSVHVDCTDEYRTTTIPSDDVRLVNLDNIM